MSSTQTQQEQLMTELLQLYELGFSTESNDRTFTWKFPFTTDKIILHYSSSLFECDTAGYLSATEALRTILKENESWAD